MTAIQETGSGGIGAVSVGISEWIVESAIVLVLILVLFGGWKLVKVLLVALKG